VVAEVAGAASSILQSSFVFPNGHLGAGDGLASFGVNDGAEAGDFGGEGTRRRCVVSGDWPGSNQDKCQQNDANEFLAAVVPGFPLRDH
jgi:hypothetical protein